MAGLFGRPVEAARALSGCLGQVASIRPVVLDDGPERGVRALLCDTGGGLAFSVLVDRALDLGTASFWGVPLAWQSPAGFRHPGLHDPHGDGGLGFMRSFSGLLVTCGLDHTRQPVGPHPLHGLLPYTPARLARADIDLAADAIVIEGEVVQWRLGAEHLVLRRKITAPLGAAVLHILDEVTNAAPVATPQAMLYHVNLGFPALAPGTIVTLGGIVLRGPLELPQSGTAASVISLDSPASETACAVVETPLAGATFDALRVTLSYRTDTLPCFACWLDPAPGTCALGIEPCTSARQPDGTSTPEPELAPGATRRYAWSLAMEAGRGSPAGRGGGAG